MHTGVWMDGWMGIAAQFPNRFMFFPGMFPPPPPSGYQCQHINCAPSRENVLVVIAKVKSNPRDFYLFWLLIAQ